VDGWLQELHAARVMKLGVGDEDTVASKHGSIEADFQSWNSLLWARVDRLRSACQSDATEQVQARVHSASQDPSGPRTATHKTCHASLPVYPSVSPTLAMKRRTFLMGPHGSRFIPRSNDPRDETLDKPHDRVGYVWMKIHIIQQ
jgi:hypothetical protein